MSTAKVKISIAGDIDALNTLNQMADEVKKAARPQSNAGDPHDFIRIDIDRFFDAYGRHEDALRQIFNMPPNMPTQTQNILMRKIAKEALRL